MVRTPAKLSIDDRLARAKARTDRLVGHTASLFLMQAANATVIYSPALAEQIPTSFAAHAFNQFQRSMHLFELVRLTALWDRYGDDRESIPTIVDLIDHKVILAKVVDAERSHYLNHPEPRDLTPSEDPAYVAMKAAWWEEYQIKWAEEAGNRAQDRLKFAIERTREIAASDRLKALIEVRNQIAHNLDFQPGTNTPTEPGRTLKYGDEKSLLEDTVLIADALHLALNGTSFMWDDSREQAQRWADELWKNCKFEIPKSGRRGSSPPAGQR
ncbi:hypothetical protein [Mesorhizobium sp.]|jgi:hypothetical protein|uniref:AbiU2 domain-containing protein n=1 Tax=Mesorhizobium sp. TaxID=1871066 RepID=UPI0012032AB6|nr:hypothetical protein [Mesorhizobium sp.]TIL41993.1 MAG: hypothetical protein E5Y86_29535 [Mesorhizobium sp.]TIL49896.1 MAG: hypothetical protein E5Y83_24035 [Mesorhizobium sp.]